MRRDTRTRILVTSLLLFNEHGEPATTTNQIADELDISPGNLHYHFRKRRQIVEALLDEFQADARRVLATPESASLDDFWVFLHLLLELTAAYRFLFRDLEALTDTYPRVGQALGHFATGLRATFELYLRQLAKHGTLNLAETEARRLARNLAVIALFSDRFDRLTGTRDSADVAAVRVANSILTAMRPFASGSAAGHIDELAKRYET